MQGRFQMLLILLLAGDSQFNFLFFHPKHFGWRLLFTCGRAELGLLLRPIRQFNVLFLEDYRRMLASRVRHKLLLHFLASLVALLGRGLRPGVRLLKLQLHLSVFYQHDPICRCRLVEANVVVRPRSPLGR